MSELSENDQLGHAHDVRYDCIAIVPSLIQKERDVSVIYFRFYIPLLKKLSVDYHLRYPAKDVVPEYKYFDSVFCFASHGS